MPYGGKYQLTETQAMVAKLPVLKGKTDTVTMMSYGFDPYLSSWSPYHGAIYAVTRVCCEDRGSRWRLQQDPFHIPGVFPQNDRRSEPDGVSRLQHCSVLTMHSSDSDFHLSEEKTVCPEPLNEIDVPPTLVSFAVDVATVKRHHHTGT